MNLGILSTVVLIKDLPKYGLKAGDIGTIVERYEPDGIEVEFVTASGRTRALVTLKTNDVRTIADSDVLTVRSLDAA